MGCTHVNDAVRALAEIPRLALLLHEVRPTHSRLQRCHGTKIDIERIWEEIMAYGQGEKRKRD
jgi:hypothetical protein